MPDRLQEIRARLDAVNGLDGADWNLVYEPGPDGDPDANLIAHAPADIAYLLDRVEKYRTQLEADGWIVAD